MKKSILFIGLVLIAAVVAVLYSGCKEEDKPKPDASFSFVASGDGRTIAFTNESTDADTYAWEFGDGESSVEESPTHTYPDYGTFTIKLTATGGGGTDEFSYNLVVTKASPVKLDDGTLDDWTTIPYAFESVDNNGGVIEKVKVDYDGEFIYFYMQVKDQLTDSLPTGIHFDLDNDSLTGFLPWTNTGIGGEAYIEAGITTGSWSVIFEHDITAGQADWAWIELALTDYLVNGTHIQDGEFVKVEWAVRKSKLSANTVNGQVNLGNKVTIIINHYVEWEPAGFFPGNGQKAYVLTMI